MLFAGLRLEASNGQLGETWASERTGTHNLLGPTSCNPVANCPLMHLSSVQGRQEDHQRALSVGGASSREIQTTYMGSMDVLVKISLGSRWNLLAHSPFSSSGPFSSVLVRKSDRWEVCTQGNSTALSVTLITLMTLFHAKIVLFWLFGFSSRQP